MDGRVRLNRDILKNMRRQLGVSQEQVAFRCAEQGLCVSIASLKRAETSKNILYRTARDIALFYQVQLETLLLESVSDDAFCPMSDNAEYITYQNSIILLSVTYSSVTDIDEVLSLCQYELSYSNATLIEKSNNAFLVGIGLTLSSDNDATNAIHCATHLKRALTTHIDTNLPIAITISFATAVHTKKESEDAFNILPASIEAHWRYAERCSQGTTLVTSGIKKSSERSLVFDRIEKTSAPSLWEYQAGQLSDEHEYPLVGRRVELLQCKSVLESTQSYQLAQLVCLQGAAGHGKTRFLQEISHRAKDNGFSVFIVCVLDFASEKHQQALPSLFKQLFLLNCAEGDVEAFDCPEKCGIDFSSDLEAMVVARSWLDLTLTEERETLLNNFSQFDLIQAKCRALALVLNARSVDKPLLIGIEDLHWADEALLQTLQGLIPLVSNSAVVFVVSTRPDTESVLNFLRTPWESPFLTLNLSPLSRDDALVMAKQLSKESDFFLQKCVDRAEGNPLFLEQVLIGGEANDDVGTLPYTIQSIVLSKFSRLNDVDKKAVQIAAVLGKRFSLETLVSLIGDVTYSPQALFEHLLMFKKHDDLMFCHALIQECIYQSIVDKDLIALHCLCSKWYEKNDLIQYGHHLHCAKNESAPEAIYNAVVLLNQRYQFNAALNFIHIALDINYICFDVNDFLLVKAETLIKLGYIDAAVETYQVIIDGECDSDVRTKSFVGKATCLNTLDHFEQAVEALNEAENIAEIDCNDELTAKINYLKGNFYFPKGEVALCEKYQHKALAFARRSGDVEMQARAHGSLGDAAYSKGLMYTAFEHIQACLDLCHTHNLLSVKAANLFMLGTVNIYQNEWKNALNNALESASLATKVGHKRAEIVSRLTAAWVLADNIQLDEALLQAEKGLSLAKTIGAKRFEPFLLEVIARIYYLQHQHDLALQAIDEGIKLVKECGAESFIGPWLYGTRASISTTLNEANSYLQEGQQVLEQGCVGHNYFRFYAAAIDVGIQFKATDIIGRYTQNLRDYTFREPTPWSEIHINRGELMLELITRQPNTHHNAKMQALIQRATKAGIRSALPPLEASLSASLVG